MQPLPLWLPARCREAASGFRGRSRLSAEAQGHMAAGRQRFPLLPGNSVRLSPVGFVVTPLPLGLAVRSQAFSTRLP